MCIYSVKRQYLPTGNGPEEGALVIGSSVEVNIERADYRFTAV